MDIPLTRPYWDRREERAVVRSLRDSLGTGDGEACLTAERMLARIANVRHALVVPSCTHGLELAVRVLGAGPGDEVILPSFTMTSTANAVILAGATPVFADIDPSYFNIDPVSIEKRITKRTKGIIVVHYAGMPCMMEEIRAIARRYKLWVVEDAAHAIGATYKGTALGAWSDIGVYSFHGTKNVACGEGGAVLTDNDRLASAMHVFRANGTNRKAFLQGKVDKYGWTGAGSSYYLSDILASILVSQLEKLPVITDRRVRIAAWYTDGLKDLGDRLILPPTPPRGTKPNWHIYAVRFKDAAKRDAFIRAMRKRNVEVSSHYVPLHTSPMGRKIGAHTVALPVTDQVAGSIVRLPVFPGLAKSDVLGIIRMIHELLPKPKHQ